MEPLNKEKVFDDAMDYIAGSCMVTPQAALETILDETGISVTTEMVQKFEKFLEKNECFECDICGWWTHPGEDSFPTCNDCLNQIEDEDE